jgi:hypothetical protein
MAKKVNITVNVDSISQALLNASKKPLSPDMSRLPALPRANRTSHMNKPLLFFTCKTPDRQAAYMLPFLGTVPLTKQITSLVTFHIPHEHVCTYIHAQGTNAVDRPFQ